MNVARSTGSNSGFFLRVGHRDSRNVLKTNHWVFQDAPIETLRPNWLVLCIAPDEEISLQFQVKCPGRWWTSPP
jgi:glucose-6-phosphate 1-dehydrogenase